MAMSALKPNPVGLGLTGKNEWPKTARDRMRQRLYALYGRDTANTIMQNIWNGIQNFDGKDIDMMFILGEELSVNEIAEKFECDLVLAAMAVEGILWEIKK